MSIIVYKWYFSTARGLLKTIVSFKCFKYLSRTLSYTMNYLENIFSIADIKKKFSSVLIKIITDFIDALCCTLLLDD